VKYEDSMRVRSHPGGWHVEKWESSGLEKVTLRVERGYELVDVDVDSEREVPIV